MKTRNNRRKLARETCIVLALFIASVGGTLLFNANEQAEGFMTFPQEYGLILGVIGQVHEDQWDIVYNFAPDCPASKFTSENFSALERAIEKNIRLWLEPLQELAQQRNKRLVDKFTFHRVKLWRSEEDRDKSPTSRVASKNVLRIKPQMAFEFLCQHGNSTAWSSTRGLNRVQMSTTWAVDLISSELPYSLGTLAHEIGHVFGLSDTYTGKLNVDPDKNGGIAQLVGNQPMSIMGSYRIGLSEDDKRGIRWLYRYYYDKNVDLQDCLDDNYVFEQLNDEVGGCVPRYPMVFEARQGHASGIDLMLRDDPKIKDIPDEDGYTALHYLSIYANIDRLSGAMEQYLLRNDFDINVKNKHGDTPLHLAAVYDNQQVCGQLVADARIKVNALNTLNYTPLHYAARYGRVKIVKLLLAHQDINPNLRNDAGFTPLQLAMQGGAVAAAASDTSFQAQHPELWVSLSEENRQQLLERSRLSPAELQRARAEIAALLRAHPGIILPEASDVNGDGVVNILDLVKVSNAFGQRGPVPEDVNGDGIVNIQDLVWVSGAFGQ